MFSIFKKKRNDEKPQNKLSVAEDLRQQTLKVLRDKYFVAKDIKQQALRVLRERADDFKKTGGADRIIVECRKAASNGEYFLHLKASDYNYMDVLLSLHDEGFSVIDMEDEIEIRWGNFEK